MHSLFTHILFTRSLFPQAWLLAAAILATSTVPSNIYADPPNVVIAFADDFGRHLSAYAALEPGGLNDFIKTPNIDRIAKEGVLCTRAYVNAPSCTPCRSSFLSGQYFWRTGRGAILSGAVWDSSIPTFPLLLEAAGYHIGHSHKVWSPGTPADAPFGGKRTAFVSAGRQFNDFSEALTASPSPDELRADLFREVRENFQAFLKARPGLEPFCYWFGPTNCHRKWIAGSGQALWKINPDDLKGRLPPYLPDVPEIRQDVADYFGEIQAFDTAVGVLLDELEKTGQLDNTMIIVSGDHGMPGVPHGKCNLYDFGTQVSLAIRWPKEIPAGRVIDDFISLPDLAPTLVNAAGLEPPSTMTGKSLLTVLRSSKSGQVDPQRDHIVVGRERHVNTARTDNLPYPQRALRTEKYLYIRNFKPDRWPMGTAVGFGAEAGDMPGVTDLTENTFAAFADMDASPTKAWLVTHRDDPKYKALFEATFGLRPEEELYDLTVDPHQMQNVAADPKYQEIKRQQSDRLMKILQDSGDPRVTGAGDTFDLPPYTTGER